LQIELERNSKMCDICVSGCSVKAKFTNNKAEKTLVDYYSHSTNMESLVKINILVKFEMFVQWIHIESVFVNHPQIKDCYN